MSKMLTLLQAFDKHGCDKGTDKHRYDQVYTPYFEPIRDMKFNMLEIGCFRGESTAAWVDYFPNATIYTIDIFERVNEKDIDILNHPRVRWIKSSSMDPELPSKIKEQWGDDIQFSFIIDDGAHWPKANLDTFNNCFPFLADNGMYFIEDVWMLDVIAARGETDVWLTSQPHLYVMDHHVEMMDTLNKYTVVHHDQTQQVRKHPTKNFMERFPDSYILAVKK